MKRWMMAWIVVAGFGLAVAAQAATPDAAKAFVDGFASKVLDIVRRDDWSKSEKQQKIEALFSDKVDIDFIAKFVLGPSWRTATAQQQADYVGAYKPFILKNYSGRLTKYSGQTYTLKSARGEGDVAYVTMLILDPNGENITLEYRLRDANGAFKIVDITVEGVSLLNTQRSEFKSVINSKGIDGLIEALKQQVAAQG
ncbi:MAG: ABC transporter substrate-binding protein [Alphaproteobacteria bacterium]|nr:ABC transporter substrate-binding protein [Alphaproteobacteria bacterium]